MILQYNLKSNRKEDKFTMTIRQLCKLTIKIIKNSRDIIIRNSETNTIIISSQL